MQDDNHQKAKGQDPPFVLQGSEAALLVSELNKEWLINGLDKFYSQEIPPKNRRDQGLLINVHKSRDIIEQH